MAVSAHIPKNILIPKSWKAVVFVDERATAEQEGVLLQLFTGQLGGAVADLAGLIGEVVAVERAPITFTVEGGKGRISIGKIVEAEMAPFVGATGKPDDARRDGIQHDPGLPRLRQQGQPVHTRRQLARHPERRPPGPQRPPGPLPLRGLTPAETDMFAPAHLRVPRRDRTILGGSLAALAVARLARARGCGRARRTALPPSTRAARLRSPLEAALFSLGWVLMIVAMMLPSSIPLVMTFGALVRRRRRPGLLVLLLLVGYLLVWGGVRARRVARGTALSMPRSTRCRGSPSTRRSSSATTLAVAGLWQFSPLRIAASRSAGARSASSINRWRGTSERPEALRMGIAHGAFCVGCCWSLMLVMFGVGLASLARCSCSAG